MKSKPTVDWLVIGGWSGKKPLRPGVIESARRIVLACQGEQIPCFVKDNFTTAAPNTEWPQEIPT
jgi:hypothetical protein